MLMWSTLLVQGIFWPPPVRHMPNCWRELGLCAYRQYIMYSSNTIFLTKFCFVERKLQIMTWMLESNKEAL